MSIQPHAFVAMPTGDRTGANGEPIEFGRVYRELIKPALETAGAHILRSEQDDAAPGGVDNDSLQALLIADLVVFDLSADDPNVWYQLGMRHALRARGVVLIAGGRSLDAFHPYTDRTLCYPVSGGGPDPMHARAAREQLVDMITASMESWHGLKVSPLFRRVPQLPEPRCDALKVDGARTFWEAHEHWQERVRHVCRQGRVGDLLVLADEAPIAAFRADAWLRAGEKLRRLGRYRFALEQLEKGLAVAPSHRDGLREKGICLHQMALQGFDGYSLDMARSYFRTLLQDAPKDAESWWLLGQVEEDAWRTAWQQADADPAQRRAVACEHDASLRAAINCYETAFRSDQRHYRAGVRALLLMRLYEHLTQATFYRSTFDAMAGAVRFAAQCEDRSTALYRARTALAELELLTGTVASTEAAYAEAVNVSGDEAAGLAISRALLAMLHDLDMGDDRLDVAADVLDRAMQQLPGAQREWAPRRVVLFAGHGFDAPDRIEPRLPLDKIETIKSRIAVELQAIEAGAEDLALSLGGCGSELLFTEVCQSMGVRVSWLQARRATDLPDEPQGSGAESCRGRYLEARQKLGRPVLVMAQQLGDLPPTIDPAYLDERCNLWLLYTALAWGVDKVHFVCLWDGAPGDGPGGMARLYEEVSRRDGQVHWIDTRTL